MAEGELGAVFRGLAKDAATAGRNAAESVAKFTEKTAEIEEKNVAELAAADARTAERLQAAGKKGDGADGRSGAVTPPAGPPWPARDDIPGQARGKLLSPPNNRHTVAGARHGEIRPDNSVILRGNEAEVRNDIGQIAAGNAEWRPSTGRYEVNGRSYGIEPNGTVFPDSGPGIVKLDRNEYAALKEIARADGDVGSVKAFAHNPRFLSNPDAIAKAKAIYDGTYSE